jgi:hypothetical protein
MRCFLRSVGQRQQMIDRATSGGPWVALKDELRRGWREIPERLFGAADAGQDL